MTNNNATKTKNNQILFVTLRSVNANLRIILKISTIIRHILSLVTLIFGCLQLSATDYEIVGTVVDSISGEPVPYVAIYSQKRRGGFMSDEEGRFKITLQSPTDEFTVTGLGFVKKKVKLNAADSPIIIAILPKNLTFDEIVVKPKREKYSKKNNPAVDFVNKIRNSRNENDPHNHDYYHYQKYEKFTLALNDFKMEDVSKGLNKKFKFMKEYIDTSEVSGKQILNVSIKEKVSDTYYRKEPEKEREVVSGVRRVGIDDIIDQEAMQTFIDDMVREIDIYKNDVTILRNRFVSPLSKIGPDFYKYYLSDTINVNGETCIELSFTPRTAESFGFHGRLYVPVNDTTMFVKKIVMGVPKSINLNFVDKLYINQEYVKADNGSRLKTREDMTMELSVIGKGQGLYVRRNTTYDNHDFEPPTNMAIFDSGKRSFEIMGARSRDDDFWDENRKTRITNNERQIDKLIDALRRTPIYYYTEKALKYAVTGYVPNSAKSKINYGPLNTTFSGNALEGFRIRAGGMTTANLSKHLFFRGYMAYGFKDKKLKYSAEIDYSFTPKRYHSEEFPIHGFRLTHTYDVDKLGQHYLFTNQDNVFLVLKRKSDRQMTYRRLTKGEYILEMDNGFSLKASIEQKQQQATEFIPFVNGNGESFDHINTSSLGIELRYAPGEKFFQTKTERIPVNLDAPVLVLSHKFAPAGSFGNRFTINRTEISAQKRFWFSAFGYTDIIVKAGKVWSKVPFTELLIPNANMSYTIQPESYPLMNPMEFINDSYCSWDLTYWANGNILNHVPLLKKLRLREAFSFRGLFGNLSDKNNPWLNPGQIQFPQGAGTRLMTRRPYMEAGVGIDNILKCLRVDYVWRLSYRDTPGVNRSGVRIAFHMTF